MRKWLVLLLGCLALGSVAAGCGDDGDDEGGGGGTPPATEQSSDGGGGDAGGGSSAVTIKEFSFKPGDVKVKAGDTVSWTNEDSAGHDVTGDSFKSGDTGGLGQGDSFEHTFEEAGSFSYVCSVHPNMKGTITVQ